MCMKNENKYGECADRMFFNRHLTGMKCYEYDPNDDGTCTGWSEDTILDIIENNMHASILDKESARRDMLDLLDRWHDNGIMVPRKGGASHILVDFSDLKETLKDMGMID